MDLFICRGECKNCQETNCPYKNDNIFQDNVMHNQLMTLVRDEILHPSSLIEILQENNLSLFNVINAWDIDSQNISIKEIRKYIISQFPQAFRNDMPAEIDAIFQNSIIRLTRKIDDVLHHKCQQQECFTCFLQKCCPQTETLCGA